MSELVRIHPGTDKEYNFIKSTFLRSYQNSSKFCESLPKEVYYAFHPSIVDSLLTKSKILCAFPVTEPEVIAGYIVYEEKDIVHFLYVKYPMRKFGIGTALFKESKINPESFSYTHRTDDCNWINGVHRRVDGRRMWVQGKYPNARYNPYVI